MDIRELAYVVIGAPELDAWRDFGAGVLGMMPLEGPNGELYLKMDARAFRLLVVNHEQHKFLGSGWLVSGEQAWLSARKEFEDRGISTRPGTDPRHTRQLQAYFEFEDPAGNRHEIGWGPISDFKRFVSPVGVPSFVTGEQGLGHVVLPAGDKLEDMVSFWVDFMQFGVSDILHVDPATALKKVVFLHANNPRQHSLAFAPMESPVGCFHMMVQVPKIDDVGYALDRVAAQGVRLATSLGRHVNDQMISFYMETPSGFRIEYGTGGLEKDWDRNVVFETTRGSLWGHQPLK